MNPRRKKSTPRPPLQTVTPPDSLAPYGLGFDGYFASESEDEDGLHFAEASPERRRRLQRYVSVTVAACVALCLAAIVRVGIARVRAGSEPEPTFAASRVVPALPAPPPVTVAVVAPAALPFGPASTPAPAVTEPAAQQAAVVAPTKTPLQEKEAARHALEHGKMRDAVAAATRSTAGDPTDAEAWLLLGAANQELGHRTEARAAFKTCLTSAKKGPSSECRAMLR